MSKDTARRLAMPRGSPCLLIQDVACHLGSGNILIEEVCLVSTCAPGDLAVSSCSINVR